MKTKTIMEINEIIDMCEKISDYEYPRKIFKEDMTKYNWLLIHLKGLSQELVNFHIPTIENLLKQNK